MKIQSLLTLAVTSALITSGSAAITMDWVNVGNAGNAADTADGDSGTVGSQYYGAVAYAYQIGKYEVTNTQYADFLNAADPSGANANGIYNISMGSNSLGGITYTAGSGSGAKYTLRTNMGDKPVNYVSWYDAARFANWMMNGQGAGSTETGAYTLSGNTGIITKNVGASVYLPSEDEWYKAAYYKAANTSYSLYSNGQSTITTADANYSSSALTNVGIYVGSSYGTRDQGGNVWEWNDAEIGSSRGLRGGSFLDGEYYLRASGRSDFGPAVEDNFVGFRVASRSIAAVPEPSGLLTTAALVGSSLLLRRRSKNSL
jgi:formylglycine-generating enzyme required for sulfatase activity